MLQSFGYETVKNIFLSQDNFDNDVIRKNRFIVYTDEKKADYNKLIKGILAGGIHLHFVSLQNECIYSIYDDRGLDVVFMSRERGKIFYKKLKPYLLEYYHKRMKEIFEE